MTAIAKIKAWGDVQQGAVEQMEALMEYGDVYGAALMADHHLGYSQPIGGVVAYRNSVSPSGVGFDIACGNKAVRTNLKGSDLNALTRRAVADLIFERVEFGIGRKRATRVDHALFDSDAWDVLADVAGRHEHDGLKAKARNQLGTVGSGNHYVDVFVEDATDDVWIGVHFGSRGLGHTIATGFLKMGAGYGWSEKLPKGDRYESEVPTLLDLDSDIGRAYLELMNLAGEYAYAGRDDVVSTVLDIMGATADNDIHNHHNFAWMEEHGGETVNVIRKGATPLYPGQQSFIGGSMCDISVIVEGVDCDEAVETMRSTVHGAGRVMGRMQAKGKQCRVCKGAGCPEGTVREPQETQPCDGSGWTRKPNVTEEQWRESVRDYGIELRGAGVDESPFVYRKLDGVLDAHSASTKVLHTLRPIIVCMAGADIRDPYKD